MLIKKINDFDNLNEGILSSLMKGVKNIFTSEKGKIEDILNKIKKSRIEEVEHAIKTEKEISEIPQEGSTDSKFISTNLRRQSRSYSALKGREINSLVREANNIIKNDPQLDAFFNSELANIEMEAQEKLIKSIQSYSDPGYISQLNSEFEDLVKDANKKSEIYGNIYTSTGSYLPEIDVPNSMSDDVVKFLNLTSKDAAFTTRELGKEELNNYYTQIKDFFFDLEDKYSNSMDNIKRGRKEAEKTGNRSQLKNIEREEITLKYHLRKAIDKLKGRLNTIEKEMRLRRNA